jgi:hypothetical protein
MPPGRPRKRRRTTPPWDTLPDDVLQSIYFAVFAGRDEPCYLGPLDTDKRPLHPRRAPHMSYFVKLGIGRMRSMALVCRAFHRAAVKLPRYVLLRWIVRRRCEELALHVSRPLGAPQYPLPNPEVAHHILQRAVMHSYYRGRRDIVSIMRRYRDSRTLVHQDDYIRARVINSITLRDTVDPKREGLAIPAYHFCTQQQLLAVIAVDYAYGSGCAERYNWSELYDAVSPDAIIATKEGALSPRSAYRVYVGMQRLAVRARPRAVVPHLVTVHPNSLLQKTPADGPVFVPGTGVELHDRRPALPRVVIDDALRTNPYAFKHLPSIDRFDKRIYIPAVRRHPESLEWVAHIALEAGGEHAKRFLRGYIRRHFRSPRCMQLVPMSIRKDKPFIRQCLRSISRNDPETRGELLSAMPKSTRACPVLCDTVFDDDASAGFASAPGVFVVYRERPVTLYGAPDGGVWRKLE